MIKKFKQHIESKIKIHLSEILPKEELEDQFLKLREVFNIDLFILYTDYGKKLYDNDRLIEYDQKEGCYTVIAFKIKSEEESNEWKDVMYRIKEIYPVRIIIDKNYPHMKQSALIKGKIFSRKDAYKIYIVKK
jgi:hypothetical protein